MSSGSIWKEKWCRTLPHTNQKKLPVKQQHYCGFWNTYHTFQSSSFTTVTACHSKAYDGNSFPFVRHWASHCSWHQLQIYTIIKSLPNESYSISTSRPNLKKCPHVPLFSTVVTMSVWDHTDQEKKIPRIVAPQFETKMAWDRKDNVFFATKNQQK